MKKLKNWLGKIIFLASVVTLTESMKWISKDATRVVAMDALIHLGKTAQETKNGWNF